MFSVIVPVYKNEETLPDLLRRLDSLHETLDHSLEAVLVVDGSPDQCYALLDKALPACRFPSQLILLSRNFGSFAAIRMGLSAAKGPYYAVMAADLQEPEELIVESFRALQNEPIDITLGVRISRRDPWPSRCFSKIFWGVYRRFIQPAMPEGGVDIFACNQAVRDALVNFAEANSTLVGLVVWLGFRQKRIPYNRLPRAHGRSAWSTRRKLRYMLDSAYAFSDFPITLLSLTGFLGVLVSGVASLVVSLAWMCGFIAVKGYTPQILALFFSTSLILFALGIIGGYVWRAFENTKQRPLFVPMIHKSYKEGDA